MTPRLVLAQSLWHCGLYHQSLAGLSVSQCLSPRLPGDTKVWFTMWFRSCSSCCHSHARTCCQDRILRSEWWKHWRLLHYLSRVLINAYVTLCYISIRFNIIFIIFTTQACSISWQKNLYFILCFLDFRLRWVVVQPLRHFLPDTALLFMCV